MCACCVCFVVGVYMCLVVDLIDVFVCVYCMVGDSVCFVVGACLLYAVFVVVFLWGRRCCCFFSVF